MSKVFVGEIPEIITEAYKVSPKNCLMFWGPPGIGKTQGVIQSLDSLSKAIGEKFDIGIYITSQMEAIDFAMPVIVNEENGEKSYIKLPIKDFILKPGTRKILFFDEAPNATSDVQKAWQSLQTDRKIHETKLPDTVMFVAAGNRKEDRAGSNGMLSALANRMEHYDCSASFEDWQSWAFKSNIHHSILGYLKTHPNNLNAFKANDLRNPTPRVWARISEYMKYYEKSPSNFTRRRIESMVGPEITTEFMQFLRVFDKFPTKEEIISAPDHCKLPEEPDIQYSLSVSIFNWIDEKNADAAFEYIFRMNKEFQAMFVTQIGKHKQDILRTSKVGKAWCVKNLNFLRETR